MRISDWSSDVCSSDLNNPAMARWDRHRRESLAHIESLEPRRRNASLAVTDKINRPGTFALSAVTGSLQWHQAESVPPELLGVRPVREIGRASRWERVWQEGQIPVVTEPLKKKK